MPNQEPKLESEGEEIPIAAEGVEGLLRRLQRGPSMIFRTQVTAAGGPAQWSRSQLPRVLKVLGADSLSESALFSESQVLWLDTERRLGDCARCPSDGAACIGASGMPEGYQATVSLRADLAYLEQSECARYREVRLIRRLEESGVDRLISRSSLKRLTATPARNVVKAFEVFLDTGRGSKSPRGIQLLIEDGQAREYGVALFRASLVNYKHARYRSVHVPTILRESREAMTEKQGTNFGELIEPDVLLLDDLDAYCLKNPWFMGEFLWVHDRRRSLEKATIITSTSRLKEGLLPGVKVLRVPSADETVEED